MTTLTINHVNTPTGLGVRVRDNNGRSTLATPDNPLRVGLMAIGLWVLQHHRTIGVEFVWDELRPEPADAACYVVTDDAPEIAAALAEIDDRAC